MARKHKVTRRCKMQQKWIKIYYLIIVSFVFLSFNLSAFASLDYYPTKGWRISTAEEQGMQSEKLLKMLESIKESQIGIQSVSIFRNGYLVLDSYIYPFEDSQKHKMWSVTKSVTSTLIGIAISKGFIKGVDQKVVEFFPEREISNLDDHKKSMTLKDLLMMTSGLKCNDGWEKNWAGVFEMMKSDDWIQYALNLPMENAPGEYFEYCNCNSHLLSAIIKKATGMNSADFANKYLFEPLGIENVKWDASPDGINIGYSGLWLEPKEMAKIGLFYLNNGKWEDKQIVPPNWIQASTKPYNDPRLLGMKYGYQWWVSPAGFFSAYGMYGQFIYVLPGKNLVAVFTGNIEGKEQFVSISLLNDFIVPSVASNESLPPNRDAIASLNALAKNLAKKPDEGISWIGQTEGTALDGIFKRTATPSFSFEYPVGSTKAEMNSPLQIMRMQTPESVAFNASLVKIPDNVTLVDFGPSFLTTVLKNYGSDIEVISNKEIILKCGTKAYRTDINWLYGGAFPIHSIFVSTYKEGQCIFVAAHPMGNPDKFAPVVQSLRCK